MTIEDALMLAKVQLSGTGSPRIDAEVLLCHILQCQPTHLHTWPDQVLTNEQQTRYEILVAERLAGKPVAHLTGERGFWSLDLKVTADTLIPRSDTELLVELALERLNAGMTIVDLGTGSGSIALALATEQPAVKILATDYSMAALKVAKENIVRHQLSNIALLQGNWCQAITAESFDMVVSNPPYIEQDDPHLSQGDVRFEPLSALASGPEGLDDIGRIVTESARCLKPAGWLLVEHGYHQSTAVRALFSDAGFENIMAMQDIGGQDRVVLGQLQV